MTRETNKPALKRGQCDCCEIGSGSIAEEIRWRERSHQRRVVCTQLSWKWMADLCFHTHTPCLKPLVLHLQRLSKLKNHKGAFWSNISWCFNGTATSQKNPSTCADPPAACYLTYVSVIIPLCKCKQHINLLYFCLATPPTARNWEKLVGLWSIWSKFLVQAPKE